MFAKILNALRELILFILFPDPTSVSPAIPDTSNKIRPAAAERPETITKNTPSVMKEIAKDLTQSLDEKLVNALIQVESGGDDYAIGDKNLPNHAYGCLQCRLPALTDVNRTNGTSYATTDLLGNRHLSIWVFHRYMDLYAPNGSLERKSRVWNGGPNGWKNPATIGYWQKVQKYL